eukprot:scaffold133175_cov32-Tisochrysis_lutea.AAC.1
MERAPTAPTSQAPARPQPGPRRHDSSTTPHRGRPKRPEPKRSQAPPDNDVDMAPPSSPLPQLQKQGTGRAFCSLFPADQQSTEPESGSAACLVRPASPTRIVKDSP